MGNYKQKLGEGVTEIKEKSNETLESGDQMTNEAEQISSILDGITLQDSEDVESIEGAAEGYQGSFDAAFESDIESAGDEISEQGEQINEEAGAELENVESGISSLENAGGVSEIGKENAESAASALEGSASEYEGIIDNSTDIVSDTQQSIQSLKSDLSGIF